MKRPLGRTANMLVTSCPSTSTRTADGSAPAGDTRSTSASPPLIRSARFDITLVVLAGQLGPLPGAGHASQQLAQLPTVPCFAMQDAAFLLILHLVPLVVVTQQVTAPRLPQVERDAHLLTDLAQLLFTRTAFACCAAQRT